jgi:ATP-dependent Clp protease ATP-binding subunit ClpA
MKEPLAEKNITITYDQQALDLIAEKSFGKPYGARDIRRVIRQDIEDKVAEIIINESSKIDTIEISVENEAITVTGKKKELTEE